MTELFGKHTASKSEVLCDARHFLDLGPNIFFSALVLIQTTSPGCGETNPNIRVEAKCEQ